MTAATSPIRLRIRPFIVAYVRSILKQNTAATSFPRAVEASGAVSSSPPAAPLVDNERNAS